MTTYACGHEGTARRCPHGCQVQSILPGLDDACRQRFLGHVLRGAPDACWSWRGSGARYGVFRVGPYVLRAHRVAWALAHDEEPGTSTVRHLCHNTRCVNPAHLELGTADRYAREREAKVVNEEGLTRIAAFTGLSEELLRQVALGNEPAQRTRRRLR